MSFNHYRSLPRSSLDKKFENPSPSSTSWSRTIYILGRRSLLWLLHMSLLRSKRVSRIPLFLFAMLGMLLAWTSAFNPSYLLSNAPSYNVQQNESVFIASNIFDESLIMGAWGDAMVGLVKELEWQLGNGNVFVSFYGGPKTALAHLRSQLEKTTAKYAIVSEEDDLVELVNLENVAVPGGEKRVKRIAYLAELRNKVLAPLTHPEAPVYDKILFVNDVVFSPQDALRLLYSTNVDQNGRAAYRAACAMDFGNVFKFYDTYATRDTEGYGVGLPFFPWFADVGEAKSRSDVLQGKDAVRVKSCWGGMVAFDAKYFQRNTTSSSVPVSLKGSGDISPLPTKHNEPAKFRSEPDPYWDASECCLINADIQRNTLPGDITDSGIYINPYVRVAYSIKTFQWLWLPRRFERLFSYPHKYITWCANLPHYNPRRTEIEGDIIKEEVLISDSGIRSRIARGGSGSERYEVVERIAGSAGFCGRRALSVIRDNVRPGKKNWEKLSLPPL